VANEPWFVAWKAIRYLRWALWLGFVGYGFYFASDRAPHLDQFGHLKPSVEMVMFGLPVAAVFAGFFELLCRGRYSGPLEDSER
jgi:hypothetical protein